jgi:signal transduction histidine kinase
MKIAKSLVVQFTALLLVVLIAVAASLTYFNGRTLSGEIVKRSNSSTDSLVELITPRLGDKYVAFGDSGTILVRQEIDKLKNYSDNITTIGIYDTNGMLLIGDSPIDDVAIPFLKLNQNTVLKTSNNIIHQVYAPFTEQFGAHRYTILYGFSDDSILESVSKAKTQSIVISTLFALTTCFMFFVLVNVLIIKRIKKIATVSVKMASSGADVVIEKQRTTEFQQLAESINNLRRDLNSKITELQDFDKVKSDFLSITSHNLRTPLTVIKGYLEMHFSRPKDIPPDAILEKMRDPIEKLGGLVEKITDISKLKLRSDMSKIKLEKIDIDVLIAEIISFVSAQHIDAADRVVTKIDQHHMSISSVKEDMIDAFSEILSNALKYSTDQVKIYAIKQSDTAMIQIVDTGIGIDSDKIKRLFSLFDRQDSAMEYNFDGVGIGLYRSKLIFDQYKCQLKVKSEPGKGTTFTVVLPLAAI